MQPDRFKKIISIIIFMLLILNVSVIFQLVYANDKLFHFHMLDVGQGDSMYIETPNANQIIIDGGPDQKAALEISRRIPFWDRNIEYIFLTHPNADHYDGLKEIIKRYRVGKIFLNGMQDNNRNYFDFLEIAKGSGAAVQSLKKGDLFAIDSLEFSFISPEKKNYKDLNDTSLVFYIKHRDVEFLLTGDADLTKLSGLRDVDILKVPHHGSRKNISEKSIAILRPEVSLISAKKGNSYGHPHRETLEILQKVKSEILRTDISGSVEIISDGESYELKE